MKKYNIIQIEEILNNPYVLKCSENNITFTKECKIESVRLRNNGYKSRDIFRELKFPEYIIKSQIPKNSVCRWSKQFQITGIDAFGKLSKRGRKLGFKGKKKINIDKLTDKEKIEYYQTENAYLKELYKEKHGFYP